MALACWHIKSDLDIVYGFIIVAIIGAIHQSRYRTDISHSGSTDATWCHQTVQTVLYTQTWPQTDCGSNVAITRYTISLVFFLIIAYLLDSQYKALTWYDISLCLALLLYVTPYSKVVCYLLFSSLSCFSIKFLTQFLQGSQMPLSWPRKWFLLRSCVSTLEAWTTCLAQVLW